MTSNLLSTRDELDIRNTLARLANLADVESDLSEYASIFTEDATWTLLSPGSQTISSSFATRAAVVEGALARRQTGRQGPGSHVVHDISNIIVRPIGSSSARTTTSWRLYGEINIQPKIIGMGRYYDLFVKQDGIWQLHERVIAPF